MLSDSSGQNAINPKGVLDRMALLNYILMIVVGVIGMSALDEDRTRVSLEEWLIYAAIIFAAWKLVKELIRLIQEHEGGL
ncbi:MAG: hypothetical protein EBT06_07445 [Gammaproteobacteria bacterium]|nr:hypothetical protein [Gammaproteobacteria bacterium]NBT44743.1 hypothetical protein [Gammaproteobacteria bacterium]NBY22117.1 hypothetical protein [Gammaproteobacteria bacterium]NDE33935.1 hypothetical protein [Gammaproteobacteria bacterium]NDE55923.1 hypothetical protein [Gammaproteobacteria bacterium]